MPLVRKIRSNKGNMVVAIPSQFVEAFNINKGDMIEIMPLKNGEIRIKKLEGKKYEKND